MVVLDQQVSSFNLRETSKKLTFKEFKAEKDENFGMLYYDFQTGDVLKIKGGKVVLVGDVNKNLGLCDDCVDFQIEDIEEIANMSELIND